MSNPISSFAATIIVSSRRPRFIYYDVWTSVWKRRATRQLWQRPSDRFIIHTGHLETFAFLRYDNKYSLRQYLRVSESGIAIIFWFPTECVQDTSPPVPRQNLLYLCSSSVEQSSTRYVPMWLFAPLQRTSKDSFIQTSLLFLNVDFHLISLDLTFNVFYEWFIYHLLFCRFYFIVF